MLGRITAGFLAVIMITMLPLKMKAVREAERMENAVRSVLEAAYEDIMADRYLSKDKWEKLLNGLKSLRVPLRVSITIGSVFVGRTGKTLRCTYTDEILEEISYKGNTIDVGDKLVSLSVTPVNENPVVNIANMFWISFIPFKKICVGG